MRGTDGDLGDDGDVDSGGEATALPAREALCDMPCLSTTIATVVLSRAPRSASFASRSLATTEPSMLSITLPTKSPPSCALRPQAACCRSAGRSART
eukprot:6668116-Prymnesium_polylepis.1